MNLKSLPLSEQGFFQLKKGLFQICKQQWVGWLTVFLSFTQVTQAQTSLDSTAQKINELDTMYVSAKKLDEARIGLSPTTGTSLYQIDATSVQTLSQGSETPINHVLLTAPGVAQDSYGQLHVRGEHADIQFRLNGILLPEGISGGFAQEVDTRFAKKVDFLTGSLPAQYGERTAGVVDIQSKSGAFENGGRIGIYGGQNDWLEPSLELQGHRGNFNFYLSGSYLQNDLGVEAPTSGNDVLHDHTQQGKGFSYLSYLINPSLRVSAMLGTSISGFQIPNNPGQDTVFSVNGIDASTHPSSGLNETQDEANHFGILSLQGSNGPLDYQVGAFLRYSRTQFNPDSIGDLIYNGVASQVFRSNTAAGFQADAGWKFTESNTVRGGAYASRQSAITNNTSAVFPADTAGNQSGATPVTIVDNNSKIGYVFNLYLQDEWKIIDQLTLNYGARFDDVNAYVQEWQISPRINLVLHLNEGTDVHAGYSRYFTPPPMESVAPKDIALFSGTTNAAEVNQASNVRSERDNYYDVGVTQNVLKNFHVGLDGYYKDAQHLLDEGQFGAALVFTPFNYATGQVYGLELSTSYHDENISGYINAAYSQAKGQHIESSEFSFGQDELDYIAAHEIYLDHDQRVTVSYGLAFTLLQTTIGLDGIYGSGLRRGFANTDKLPAYGQLNLGLSQHFVVPVLKAFDARVSLINVLDAAYELRDGSGVGVGAPQWGPRRALYAGISKPFSF
jgi:TonB dependent receptor